MPIPPFSIDGVLPPFVGSGPGGAPQDMSPYAVTALELVSSLAFTEGRKTILRGWLSHRAALRTIGFSRGFQWLDGSSLNKRIPPTLT
jgi:hypothetical protein